MDPILDDPTLLARHPATQGPDDAARTGHVVITTTEAKALARELSGQGGISHSQVLEAAAHAAGHRDWNTFHAAAPERQDDPVGRQRVIPVLRVFDHQLAREFYCSFLGFTWRWEHQFETETPVYAEVGREGCILHLSEHHGDATPGSGVMITVPDLAAYREGLLVQRHRNARPGISRDAWGQTMTVLDPFDNRIVFWQRA
ncbi:glyoxalase superfamily protein [Allobranchiibius huperziae]|uniref:Bleomycin resistance protein n=1 Tax=Allobranchiibius huperziae TaxID=1874116 RepID=A0A853DED2_9MICO|nr:hypothetical protein [Allobranchiibius huperziae]